MERQLYTVESSVCSLSVSLFYEMSLCTPLAIGLCYGARWCCCCFIFYTIHPPPAPNPNFLSSHRLLRWTYNISDLYACILFILRALSHLYTNFLSTKLIPLFASFARLSIRFLMLLSQNGVRSYFSRFAASALLHSLTHSPYVCVCVCTFLNNFNRKAFSMYGISTGNIAGYLIYMKTTAETGVFILICECVYTHVWPLLLQKLLRNSSMLNRFSKLMFFGCWLCCRWPANW